MSQSSESAISTLAADRLAVADALYRYAAGIDLRRPEVLASSLASDATIDFRAAAAKAGFEYPVLEGRDNIVSALSGSLKSLDTTHTVSNPRIVLNGDRAHLEALVEAQHLPADDHSRHYMMKNRYNVELARDGDAWVMHRLLIDNVWRDGDLTVLSVV
nr:nuclear transport factor 2 family protein [uncultured Novosphingobium sp.]